MRTDKYLWRICEDIYRQLYKEAEPSADFDELIKSEEVSKENWFMNYFLEEDREVEIIESLLKKHKCTPVERKKIRMEVYLGCAPSSVKNKKEVKNET